LVSEQISDFIISINSSPFEKDKQEKRFEKAQKFSKNLQKPLIYVNQIGGQDSLIFDGKSFVLDEKGQQKLVMKEFCEDSKIIEISKNSKQISIQVLENQKAKEENLESAEKIYSACILGLRDYIEKSGFKKILLGMSGGIDSALVASIAADALGTKNIELYALPSRYNSKTSFDDAINYSRNLEIELKNISIEKIFSSFLETMPNISSLAQENLQSRIRGNILMSLSNSTGALLLSTGNKSELAVGYATIYGDMCGAYNPIKDIYKSEIFELAKWRNKNIPTISKFQKTEIIPENIIIKEPTAELRENQKDSDSLPDYKILDQILFSLIEEEKSIQETIENGFDDKLVKKVAKLFYANEYKRKQAVLGPKISKMSFDLERRYPIINKFTF
jgi:NAD+ synthase